MFFKHDVLYHVSVFFLTIKSEQDNWNGFLAAASYVNTLVCEEA